ncbi:MAG: DUF342 domain-containing protein [Nitrospirae bacterium]|nr:DUF342 domain-containing protein [Nitrospirota bacterium]
MPELSDLAAAPPGAGSRSLILRVTVSPDEMEATATFNPLDLPLNLPRPISAEDLSEAVHDRKVVRGILDAPVADCLEKIRQREAFEGVLIARGEAAGKGIDAEFKWAEPRSQDRAPSPADEPVDFRERSTVRSVSAGDLIATKREAIAGRDGFTVTGRVLPGHAGRDESPAAGKNVEILRREDGLLEYRATTGGSCRIVENRMEVSQLTVIQGDVDLSTGNIRCKGNLEVRGRVANGFKIEVEGDLDVHEVVEAADITAGGNVRLERGVMGQDKAVIRCKGSLRAMYVERATLEVYGDVEVGNALLDSRVSCGGKIRALKGKGAILGGEVRAAQGIEVKKLGSEMAAPTSVEVGIDFVREKELKDLNLTLKTVTEELMKIERTISKDVLGREDLSWVPEEKRPQIEKIVNHWRALHLQKQQIEERRQLLQQGGGTRGSDRPTIKVTEKLAARVRVRIGPAVSTIDREYGGVTIYGGSGKNDIKIVQR